MAAGKPVNVGNLVLRKTLIGGETYDDDFQVFWDGIPIGRILKQPDIPVGRPNWFWGVNFPGQPQPSSHRGLCSDFAECKRKFQVIWSGVRSKLSKAEIAAGRRVLEQPDRRPNFQRGVTRFHACGVNAGCNCGAQLMSKTQGAADSANLGKSNQTITLILGRTKAQ